jgi:alpha-mannosidase
MTQVEPLFTGLTPGYIKRDPVAWFASHHHSAQGGNEVYAYCYLFAYVLDMPDAATTLTLPDNDKIRIMAITMADQAGSLHPAQPLYDVLGGK